MARPGGAVRSGEWPLDAVLVAMLVASFAGLTFHDLREFLVSVLVRGDTLILLGVYVALGVWWQRTRAVWARRTLLGWGCSTSSAADWAAD